MSKFTPGPWTFKEFLVDEKMRAEMREVGMAEDKVNARFINNDGVVPVTFGDGAVCSVHCRVNFKRGKGHQTIDDAERDANARLIASAPTMFAYVEKRARAGDAEAAAIMDAIGDV